MRENTKKIAIVLLVAIIAVGSYFVSGTYAKYTSSIAGNDNANVAKWSWTINKTDINTYADSIKTEAYTFDLFNTIKDTKDSNDETDVAENLIAPGTKGAITIDIKNNSEVNATYAIAFTETQSNQPEGVTRIPVEYSLDGESWTTDITTLKVDATNIAMGASATQTTVYWRWVYSTDDAADIIDTKIGFEANATNVPNVKVTATVTVTQVD